ncbi:hypothetical protein C8F04DRAFT_1406123 [Mycena alexandri]|uniref:F-box domain-containing protein n=1 Tax=Mycena alexandri TaxID=1745969 RepID=A0AAD6WMY0_9AGAR|nr:hypothetical protein C8F04DRAFT_1406123 [Mycena alexandri]
MFPFGIPTIPADASTAVQRAFLVEIANTISQFRNYLEQLGDIQRNAEAILAAVTYPVLTLPNEITSRIFTACLPSHGRVRSSPHAAPLLLAQICRHWREVALSTCELWSSADLGTFREDQASCLLETWFIRAKCSPLSLTLRDRWVWDTRDFRPKKEDLRLIPIFSSSLQRLELHIPNELLRQLQPFPRFPNLQRLRLFDSHRSDEMSPMDILDILAKAPCLVELHLSRLPVEAVSFMASLTSLEITRATDVTTFLHTLTVLPLLAHFGCRLQGTIEEAATQPITSLLLRSLALESEYDLPEDNIIPTLTFLTLPNLNRLKLEGKSTLEGVLSFLSRSSCTLDNVHLNLGNYSSEERVSCLVAFPTLSTLHVTLPHDDKEGNDHFLDILTSTTPTLMPQLQTLSIFAVEQRINYFLLIQMLRSRRALEGPAVLHTFRLELEEDPECSDAISWLPGPLEGEAFERLIMDGLKFKIEWANSTLWPETTIVDACETFSYW